MERKLERENTNQIIKNFKDLTLENPDPIKIAEKFSRSQYNTLSPKDKIDAFSELTEQLLKTNSKLFTKFADERSQSAYTTPHRERAKVKEDAEKAIQINNAVVKIQSNWRGHQSREKFKDLMAQNTSKTHGNFEFVELLKGLDNLLQEKGLSLELIYKISDSNENGILIDSFINIITGLRLSLGTSHLKKICEEIDEDNTGYIKFNDYMQCLESIGIQTKMYSEKRIDYSQESMSKLIGVLSRKSMSPADFFDSVSGSKKEKETSLELLIKGIHNLEAGIYKREIRAIISYLDPQKTGKIQKEDFLLVCKSAEAIWNYQKCLKTSKPNIIQSPKKMKFDTQTLTDLGEIVKKMENTPDKNIEKFITFIGEKAELTQPKLLNKFKEFYKDSLESSEILLIIKSLPFNNDFLTGLQIKSELSKILKRTDQSPQGEKPLNAYFSEFVAYLKEVKNISVSAYLKKHAVRESGTINYEKFKKIINYSGKKFSVEIIQNMWSSLIPNTNNEIESLTLIKVLESYENTEKINQSQLSENIEKTLFTKLDNIMLDHNISITDLFVGKEKISYDDFFEKFKEWIDASDLNKIIDILKENNKNVELTQENLINHIKNIREKPISQDLNEESKISIIPIKENIVYTDDQPIETIPNKSFVAQISEIIKKTPASLFIEFLLSINWAENTRPAKSEIQEILSKKFEKNLSAEEQKIIQNVLINENEENMKIISVLRFYDENYETQEFDKIMLKFDLLLLKSVFLNSKKLSVNEFFSDLGLVESQRISQKIMIEFLKQNFMVTNKSAKRLCDFFAAGVSLISVQKMIKEIQNYEFNIENNENNENNEKQSQAGTENNEEKKEEIKSENMPNLIIDLEKKCNKELVEMFDNLEINSGGNIEIENILKIIKNECSTLEEKDIKNALFPLFESENVNSISVNDIQEFLMVSTKTKAPSLILQIKLLKFDAKIAGKSMKEFLSDVGLAPEIQLPVAEFSKILIEQLKFHPQVAKLICERVERNGKVRSSDIYASFITPPGTPSFSNPNTSNLESPDQKSQLDPNSPAGLISLWETQGKPLNSVLEILSFNEKNCCSVAAFVSALTNLYPMSSPKEKMIISRAIDANKKGMINLNDLIKFIEENSKTSEFADVAPILNLIELKSAELGTKEEILMASAKEFADKQINILKLSKKDAYHVHYRMASKTVHPLEEKKQKSEQHSLLSVKKCESPPPEVEISRNCPLIQKICDFLYPNPENPKPTMSEEILFRQMDTNQDGFVRKIEVLRWLAKVKIQSNESEIDEFFAIVDINKDNALGLEEVLEALKKAKGKLDKGKLLTTGQVKKDPDVLLKLGLSKIKKYIESANYKGIHLEDKFMSFDKDGKGCLDINEFKDALKNLNIALSQDEIE